jgi:PLD-like domain
MRSRAKNGRLRVQAIAGTHTVLLGFDLDDPSGCLGFAIQRADHTEDETYWLRGMKTFEEVVPFPVPGVDYSTREQPIQAFQWGDYTAKPDHEYTYRVVALEGAPKSLSVLADVSVVVGTESEDDGHHGIWFNRGVAGSQAYVKRFGAYTPPVDADEDHPAFAWLSRGLGEAFRDFVRRAEDGSWKLRGAFYEFTWAAALEEFAQAKSRGVDLKLIVHGRDKDPVGGADKDRTAADNRIAVTSASLDGAVIWREAPNKSVLQHNKFLVLEHDQSPVAVWTGSTNLTQGAIYGHLNVGHSVTDPAVAQRFLDYWEELENQKEGTAQVRVWTESKNAIDLTKAPQAGTTVVLSPRATKSTLLEWYADAFDGATSSAHITGAFGLHAVFLAKLGLDRDVVRTVLLDRKPAEDAPIPTTDPDVRTSWGDYLHEALFDVWARENLTDFNTYVKYIHTKIILIDPLTDSPTIITGSANYSDNSTTDNEENSVLIVGSGDAAAMRVADIYLTEYQRLFMHFVFRDIANRPSTPTDGGSKTSRLAPDDSWTHPHYDAGSWRARQRQTFAGSL